MADTVGMVLIFLSELFAEWFKLIIAPLTSFDMIWIIIPIYLNWIITEFVQEKKETSLGNAISNGVVALWVGLDWTKMTLLSSQGLGIREIVNYGVSFFMVLYGGLIMFEGFRAKKITKYIGRIREVTYFSLMFTPIIYGAVVISPMSVLAIVLLMPVFYLIDEIILRILPTPKEIYEESSEAGGDFKSPSMDTTSFDSGASAGAKDELSFPKEEPAIDTVQKKEDVQSHQTQQTVQQQSAMQQTQYPCPTCGGALVYVPQYQRYYCPRCQRYI